MGQEIDCWMYLSHQGRRSLRRPYQKLVEILRPRHELVLYPAPLDHLLRQQSWLVRYAVHQKCGR